MYQRINVTLPSETLKQLDEYAPKGDRSRFIHEAIQHYINQIQKQKLRQQLQEGSIRRAERDRNLAEDWFVIEEEVWQHES
ncbi:MAG: ribbon-helix-helix domain-containing protein [Spirirestis rafaelensis WJT71-NPBG6]|jgi:CopG family transcriptional regulator/antitoxin EndoAI|nr:ribbon-helix-helix domain-containing protein [Spirirestis rafaelensis WJT71-NPBG6]